jgi:dipeptidyl aminopeptidase/acylaminoacyl peptidase
LTTPVKPTLVKNETETPPPSPAPVDSLSLNSEMTPTPEWGDRNLLGKIVYVDRTANRIVVMDANGENSKEIVYVPGETYEPYLGSPVKWSPDGTRIAFGCWNLDMPQLENFRKEGERGYGKHINLCVLNLVDNLQGQSNIINHGLQVIELPEQYMLERVLPEISARLFASLSWIMEGDGLVLTPFCIVMLNADKPDCTDWGNLDYLDESNKELLRKAYFIAPSPVDKNLWALTVEEKILLMDLKKGEVTEIDTEYENPSLYWSPDGAQIAILTNKTLYLLDVQISSFDALMWTDEYHMKIEPELIIAYPGNAGFYGFKSYQVNNNIAWSHDSRNLILTVFIHYNSIIFSGVFTGIYYFDLESGELFPARVDSEELGFPTYIEPQWNILVIGETEDLGLYVTPDWYSCNDPENVCRLYE